MDKTPSFKVMQVDWAARKDDLRAVRWKVFVEEQQVPAELEWDDEDERSRHVLAVAADGTPIGTGRLLGSGHIGRMAVLKEWRGRGVGSALMRELLALASGTGQAFARLHAQTHAAGFYAKHGFVAEGKIFMEAGIPHVVMSRTLADRQS